MALPRVDGARYHWTKPVPRVVPDINSRFVSVIQAYRPLEENINYCFRNKVFLLQAFTHESYPENMRAGVSQMRPLDFLGDCAIKFLLTVHLYGCIEPLTSHCLTKARQKLECNHLFGFLVTRHGWHKYLRTGSRSLNEDIARYARSIAHRDYGDTVDCSPPKPLADVFESLAAAIYLDSNLNLDTVWEVVYPILRSHIRRELHEIAVKYLEPPSEPYESDENSFTSDVTGLGSSSYSSYLYD